MNNRPGTAVSDVAVYGQSTYGGTLPGSQTLGGVTGEADIGGALTNAPAGLVFTGLEGSTVISSTGQTLPDVRGATFNISTLAGSTTNVTAVSVAVVQQVSKAGTGALANVYGMKFEAQTAGTSRNYSVWLQGDMLMGNTAGLNIKLLDSASVERPVWYFDSLNTTYYKAASSGLAGGDVRWVAQNGDQYMQFKSPNLIVDPGGVGYQLKLGTPNGTAPLFVVSSTVVPNLNVSQLLGATWAAPAALGSTTPAGVTATAYSTATNCAVNSVSPAGCGSTASGAFVVPTTTTTYTVNTTAVTTHSRIFLFPLSFASDLPSSPTCVTPLFTTAPTISGVSAGTSFTFALTSTTGQTCWQYWIVN